VRNEENGYPVLDSNKTMSLRSPQKTFKEEILEEISEKSMEKTLDIVNQKV
jgi:hypothetical protein